mgnify:CR=1 FL=1
MKPFMGNNVTRLESDNSTLIFMTYWRENND